MESLTLRERGREREPNHQRWYAKMEARLEYAHLAHTLFTRLGTDLYAQLVLIDKVSASELSREVY